MRTLHRSCLMVATLALLNLSIHTQARAQPPKPAKPAWQYKSGEIEIPAATADEPKLAAMTPKSVKDALKYLDDGALAWTRERKCVACHSTGVYMAERSQLTHIFGPPLAEVRQEFVKSIPESVAAPTVNQGVKVYADTIFSIWRSLGLAQWDKHVTGKLSADTERSLKDMLLRQSDDGLWSTTAKVEIPYITTDFELGLEALKAVRTAPGWLSKLTDDNLLRRIKRLEQALQNYKPRNDYERVQRLQLGNVMPELVSKSERELALSLLSQYQKPDGGWSTRSFSTTSNWGNNITKENIAMIDSEPDAANPVADPFMTAFAIVLMRESGQPASDPRIQKGLAWLKSNQRQTGRWWMKSLYKNTQHYITYISTAQVLRALALCDEL